MNKGFFGGNLKYYRKRRGITQQALGERTGVGQVTIANYERGARFPAEEVLRLLAETLGVSLDSLLSVRSAGLSGRMETDFETDELMDLLLHAPFTRAREYLSGWKNRRKIRVEDVYTGILTPLLRETGDLWFRGELSVTEEHLISGKIRELITLTAEEASDEREVPGGEIRRWMGLSAPGEEHDMALLMQAQLMKLKGWDTLFLGTGVPLPDLMNMMETRRPHVLSFSVTMASHAAGLGAYLQAVSRRDVAGCRILIGGQGLPEDGKGHFPGVYGRAGSVTESISLAISNRN